MKLYRMFDMRSRLQEREARTKEGGGWVSGIKRENYTKGIGRESDKVSYRKDRAASTEQFKVGMFSTYIRSGR